MKNIKQSRFFQVCLGAILFLLTETLWAQDNNTTTTTTRHTETTTETWFIPTWGWIAGGAVLLIIIIALLTRGRTDKVVIKKTNDV